MTVPLYTMNPVKFKFFQAVCGVQMWKCGASDKVEHACTTTCVVHFYF